MHCGWRVFVRFIPTVKDSACKRADSFCIDNEWKIAGTKIKSKEGSHRQERKEEKSRRKRKKGVDKKGVKVIR